MCKTMKKFDPVKMVLPLNFISLGCSIVTIRSETLLYMSSPQRIMTRATMMTAPRMLMLMAIKVIKRDKNGDGCFSRRHGLMIRHPTSFFIFAFHSNHLLEVLIVGHHPHSALMMLWGDLQVVNVWNNAKKRIRVTNSSSFAYCS